MVFVFHFFNRKPAFLKCFVTVAINSITFLFYMYTTTNIKLAYKLFNAKGGPTLPENISLAQSLKGVIKSNEHRKRRQSF